MTSAASRPMSRQIASNAKAMIEAGYSFEAISAALDVGLYSLHLLVTGRIYPEVVPAPIAEAIHLCAPFPNRRC